MFWQVSLRVLEAPKVKILKDRQLSWLKLTKTMVLWLVRGDLIYFWLFLSCSDMVSVNLWKRRKWFAGRYEAGTAGVWGEYWTSEQGGTCNLAICYYTSDRRGSERGECDLQGGCQWLRPDLSYKGILGRGKVAYQVWFPGSWCQILGAPAGFSAVRPDYVGEMQSVLSNQPYHTPRIAGSQFLSTIG